MPQIIIHRCTLRVVRKNGWSWGPSPDRLLKAAVAALPLLIAQRLGNLLEHETDREITERLNLNVPVKLSELLELGARAESTSELSNSFSSDVLDQRLTTALQFALPLENAKLEEVSAEVPATVKPAGFEAEQSEVNRPEANPVLSTLLRWKREGELEVHLAFFSEPQLEAWQTTLAATVGSLARSKAVSWTQRISRLIRTLEEHSQISAADRVSILRRNLLVLVDIAEQLLVVPIDETELQRIFVALTAEQLLTVSQPLLDLTEHNPEVRIESSESLSGSLQPAAKVVPPAPAVTIQSATKTEFNLRSVLPFLLLGPLARAGYFQALAATLEATSLLAEAPLFAAAFAFKVLSPPARGWRRDTEDLNVAAAFAGIETPPPGDALAEFARKLSGHLAALDSLISYSLVKGHRPDGAMILHCTREENGSAGLLLVEPEGLFPVSCAGDVQSLLPTLRYFSETHLLVQQSSADKEILRQLDEAGFRFITDAPPTRGETWRELRRSPRERWYTNDVQTKQTLLERLVEDLTTTAEETGKLWQALKEDRPGIPTARHTELERSLTIAASFALGTISWVLWRKRETVTPLLALERFSTLGGKVRFTSSSVQIQLPLGQRHSDLHEHGLLADVPGLPWLGNRTVEFLGG